MGLKKVNAENIIIKDAHEGNLNHISLEIPREKLVVLTGVSGSGKSTLAMDVLYMECQRQYLEAMSFQGIAKPKVDSIENCSPAIQISQGDYRKNPRSSVGTVTDIYTDLRMIYEKLGERECPHCGERIKASACHETTEKNGTVFKVFMFCAQCGWRMDKLTRSHFSYNTREGACETCQGLGKVLRVCENRVFHVKHSLEDGAVDFWEQQYKVYQTKSLYAAFRHYGLPEGMDVPVEDYNEGQRAILYYGVESDQVRGLFPDVEIPKTVNAGKFEGVYTTLWRRISEPDGSEKRIRVYFDETICSDCGGERLSGLSRAVTVMGVRLPELAQFSLSKLMVFIEGLELGLSQAEVSFVVPYLLDAKTKIKRLCAIGLGYLSLDRQTMTLSGGEAQRVRLSGALDSEMTGIIYIMDEPTIGLHPQDTRGMISILKKLRDKGNTVIVIEHDRDVMEAADFMVDMGPGAGRYGGNIIGTGTFEAIKKQVNSVTGGFFSRVSGQGKRVVRPSDGGVIVVENACRFNLKQINVSFLTGCLTCVTGVSGSGKSTLIFEVLAKGGSDVEQVTGLSVFDRIVTVEQAQITRMRRSNVATYSEVYGGIRKIFGGLPESKEKGLTVKDFSFNSKGGRCENCEGLGSIVSNMLFFEDLEVVCPVCGGKQFNDVVLSVRYKGLNISEVLHLSVADARILFGEHPGILKILELLESVGLGYLNLGQRLNTLSGGEGQRLKLAKELMVSRGKKNLYLIDEPTVGLHPLDVEHFLVLLNRIVDEGNTVIVVEHNTQVIAAADQIIDLGPGGGAAGGRVVAVGTPEEIKKNEDSVTGRYL